MLTLRKYMMSNTCSKLHMYNMYNTPMKYAHTQGKKKQKQCATLLHNHMCKMYNTLMKHADFWEKQMKKNLFNTCSKLCARCITVVPLSFSSLLDDFCFVFFWFYHFGNKNKKSWNSCSWGGKKNANKFALLRQHVFAHYEVQQTWVFATCITH